MRLTYDPEADAAYLYLIDRIEGQITETVPAEELGASRFGPVILDFDRDGRLLGLEILGARRSLRQATPDGADGVE